MSVQAEETKDLVVLLKMMAVGRDDEGREETVMKMCSDMVKSHQPSVEVTEWFSSILGILCQIHHYLLASSPFLLASGVCYICNTASDSDRFQTGFWQLAQPLSYFTSIPFPITSHILSQLLTHNLPSLLPYPHCNH
jgi:hypothetical protein